MLAGIIKETKAGENLGACPGEIQETLFVKKNRYVFKQDCKHVYPLPQAILVKH